MSTVTVSGSSITASVSGGSPAVSASSGSTSGSITVSSGSLSSSPTVTSGYGVEGFSTAYVTGQSPYTVFSPTGPSGSSTVAVANLVPYKPEEYGWLTSILETGSLSFSVKTSTGYAAVLWWDGSISVYGSGNADAFMSAQKSIPISGNWSRSSPKQVFVWPCVAGAATLSGTLTGLSCPSRKITALSVADCGSLTSLDCSSNLIDYLDIRSTPALQELFCYGNRLGSLDLSDSTALKAVYCQSNYLASLVTTKNTLLETLQCDNNLIQTLALTTNTLLQSLYCQYNKLASINLGANTRLRNLNCSSNLINALVIPSGVTLSGQFGCNLSYNILDAAALNAFYTSLGAVSSGYLFVSGNPGSAGDNPSIATAKGYTVYGS